MVRNDRSHTTQREEEEEENQQLIEKKESKKKRMTNVTQTKLRVKERSIEPRNPEAECDRQTHHHRWC